ncbi:signal recognition particle subunit SRP68 NDAI_0F01290 [Naumovozyma dairenensis CBS 421]|uniref:Signal recognition particle subunit SRP68 n=1 Tax=Naumovozyma dairenensis (strain ATCC 10597 / BCRC 20456 / CBS 421 / NBRC 0211 / NRRL Y-12639) TaxID=1071378 RepID=G0WCD7_NAUDC|nr:hypothetical protein NDAI_0F01290 [Naumovozyma dairenensis CBS 421]CCD25448.1 hypothetical protein NDAI_0F01290 [Naumovozyma dairenensis CBS 421]
MAIYSPIAATYGVRVQQFLESQHDFFRYHDKLNKKLQKLRHNCGLVTKDTKKYTTKEKYSKITSDDYDNKNKLFGALVLLHAERDLSLVETLKLRGRERGKLKKSEKKVIATRLKKVVKTIENLVELTANEQNWVTRSQYLIFAKLATVEYLLYGKQFKRKESSKIAYDLALAFASLDHLYNLKHLDESIVESLHSRYEYTLRQHAGNLLSQVDLQNFIAHQVQDTHETDELAKLLFNNGFTIKFQDVAMEDVDSITHIQWRSFTTKVHDSEVAHAIEEAKNTTIKDVADYSTKLLRWNDALNKQEVRMAQFDEDGYQTMIATDDEEDITNTRENDEILLSYIKYNAISTSILRDNFIFKQLCKQWIAMNSKALSSRLIKFKEIDRIVKNLLKYLQDLMELPGVYSDDELMNQLALTKLYFQLHLNATCLASLYQSKGKYVESLALYVDSYQKLDSKLYEIDMESEESLLLPIELLNKKNIITLQNSIKTGISNVIALAEYEKTINKTTTNDTINNNKNNKYELSILEKFSKHEKIYPKNINLKNIFPLQPKLQPIGSKPTLFDLAFNYVNYSEENENNKSVSVTPESPPGTPSSEPPVTKKRGFLGLFGR